MSLHILFITAILLNLKWNFTIVLICISLMTNNVEHLFFFFTYWPFIYLLWRSIYSESLHFWVTSLLLNFKSFISILDTSFLLDIQFTNVFSQFIGCIFTYLIVSFEVQGSCRGLSTLNVIGWPWYAISLEILCISFIPMFNKSQT